MRIDNSKELIHKEVIVIGNGPSGIILSYMLSGNVPYIVSDAHPDEMLSARLRPLVGQCLLDQDLEHLSQGLEGRTTNEVSLLMDALLQPCADFGLELQPLVEFRKTDTKIDHIVLGRGPPGGSWHRMDPQILTLSLGSWMALPGMPLRSRDSGEKRVFASSVAKYYVRYTEKMGLTNNFRNNVIVNAVESVDREHSENLDERNKTKSLGLNNNNNDNINLFVETDDDKIEEDKTCFISNAINCLFMKDRKKVRCKRSRDQISDSNNTNYDTFLIPKPSKSNKKRSISFCCDSDTVCDRLYSKSLNDTYSRSFSLRNSCSPDLSVPSNSLNCDYNWMVNSVDTITGEKLTYTCKYLVLANGGSDQPNRLEISNEKGDPDWLMYDLRSLEHNLDVYMSDRAPEDVEPVLVVGAGLSAADAVIAMRGRNVPVIHVFRNKSPDLHKQLPENLYPEYHKVHQMMIDGGSTYPLYTAYPEFNLTDLNEKSRTVVLASKDGERTKINISFAVVLIGSRPDLSFLPKDFRLGVRKNLLIDCKTNTVYINPFTHAVKGYKNMFVVGPLAGDNFVRFLPGGALAVVSQLHRRSRN